jgi:RNA polymerase sigma-70 factor (ECF subfamily)
MKRITLVLIGLALTSFVMTAHATENLIKNPGMEAGEGSPANWSQGRDLNGVKYIWDRKVGKDSTASLCLHKTINRYFPIAQWHQTIERKEDEQALQVSVQVKAEDVKKAIIDVIFLDANGKFISHKWVSYIGIKKPGESPANHDWKEYSSQVDIPAGAKKISLGLQIYGPGKVWFDDVQMSYSK